MQATAGIAMLTLLAVACAAASGTEVPAARVASRNVDVWLPPSCGKDLQRHFPAFYMHGGHSWITRNVAGAGHSEKAWRLRVDQPLEFLIGR